MCLWMDRYIDRWRHESSDNMPRSMCECGKSTSPAIYYVHARHESLVEGLNSTQFDSVRLNWDSFWDSFCAP